MQVLRKCPLVLMQIVLLSVQLQTAAAAEDQHYGDWVVGRGNGFLYASTINDSGLALGEYCYSSSKKCTWLLAIDSTCNDGDKYPTLGNTDEGAASLVLECGGKLEDPQRYVLVFQDWKSLESLMQKSTRLGLAVPMQSDQFKVYRFSLDGMKKAQAIMETAFFSNVAPKGASPVRPMQNTSTSTL